MKDFRNRNFTARTGKITQKQINSLRETKLKNAKTQAQKRFYKSKQFDIKVKQNVKRNRVKKNLKTLNQIKDSLADTRENKKVIKNLFGEKNVIKNGKVVKTNKFTTIKQTKKLDKALKQIKKGKFSVLRRVQHKEEYKKIRGKLGKRPTTKEILTSFNRNNFYYDNKDLILQHNKNVKKHGVEKASLMKEGKKLRDQHFEELSENEKEFLELFK